MKIVAIFDDGKAGLVEKPDLTPKEDFVVVKVDAVPMCTEYKGFKAGRPGERFGHEAAGEVVEVAQPGQVKVGDRVVVQCGSGCGRCPMCLIGEVIPLIFGFPYFATFSDTGKLNLSIRITGSNGSTDQSCGTNKNQCNNSTIA